MLIGISPVLSPELLAILHRMGHGDELVLVDAHYPGESCGKRVVRADGIRVTELLDGILPLFKLDSYVNNPLIMMQANGNDELDPTVEASFREVVDKYQPEVPAITFIDRFAFYDRSKEAFAIVMTGETAKYGNIILKKGVTPI